METTNLRELAAYRLRARHDLHGFLLVWAGVSLLLLAIWAITSIGTGHPLYFWPAWPIAGMGIGAAVKTFAAYGRPLGLITQDDVDAEVSRLSR